MILILSKKKILIICSEIIKKFFHEFGAKPNKPKRLSSGSTHLRLHHGRSLGAQYAHRLKHIQHPLVLHAFQDNAERDKDTCASHSCRTVHRYGPILAKLLLGLVHLPNKINEALTRLGYALLGPVDKLKLAHRA